MALVSRSTLYNWFKRRLKPLEEQFHSWIDSFWHKNDLIPTSAIDGLDAQLANIPTQEQIDAWNGLTPGLNVVAGALTLEVLASTTIEFFVIKVTGAANCKIGVTASGSEILEVNYDAAGSYPEIIYYHFDSATTIYFTGNFQFLIYKR